MRALLICLLLALSTFTFTLEAFALPKNKDCIIINIPSRTLDLYINGKLKKTYPVGVGRSQFPTPIGNFKVITMVEKPGWENPYKASGASRIHAGNTNPLGTRWIGFMNDGKGEYGIHGTDNPASVGKYSSHGCVRMLVEDAEDLFGHVKMDMPVIVTYDTARIYNENSNVFLKLFPDAYKLGKNNNIDTIKKAVKSLNSLVLWNASTALEALKTIDNQPVKIGTIIDESDFY